MNVVDFLAKPKRFRGEIEELLNELEQLYSVRTSIGSPEFGKIGSSGTKTNADAAFAGIVNNIVDKENEVYGLVDSYLTASAEVSKAIAKLEDKRYRDILNYRFILDLSPGAAANKQGYTYRHAERLYHEALTAINHVIECPDKDGLLLE